MIADIDCPIMTNVQKRVCVEAPLSSAPAPLAGNYSEWERKHLQVSIIIAVLSMVPGCPNNFKLCGPSLLYCPLGEPLNSMLFMQIIRF